MNQTSKTIIVGLAFGLLGLLFFYCSFVVQTALGIGPVGEMDSLMSGAQSMEELEPKADELFEAGDSLLRTDRWFVIPTIMVCLGVLMGLRRHSAWAIPLVVLPTAVFASLFKPDLFVSMLVGYSAVVLASFWIATRIRSQGRSAHESANS